MSKSNKTQGESATLAVVASDPSLDRDAPEEMREAYAVAIRMELSRQKLKQKDVIAATGISQSKLSLSLNAIRNFKLWELRSIEKFLGRSFDPGEVDKKKNREAYIEARRGFSERLRRRREELGLSPEQVASSFLDVNDYNELENAIRDPYIYELNVIAFQLHVDTIWLLRGIDASTPPPKGSH